MMMAMLEGAVTSILIFFITASCAAPLAFAVCAARMSRNKVICRVTRGYLLIIRGTPLLLQLLVVYFGPGLFVVWLNKTFGVNVHILWPRFLAANVALILNYSAYFAEIYRGGIESIPQGQWEAAKVLCYTRRQTNMVIILPQVVKRILPAFAGEMMTLVKDTALVQVVGVSELLRVAKETQSRLFSFTPLFIAGVFYLVMNWAVEIAFNRIEKRLSYYK